MDSLRGRVRKLKILYQYVWSLPPTVHEFNRVKSPHFGIDYVVVVVDHIIHKAVLFQIRKIKNK